jgi:hypothetical protein
MNRTMRSSAAAPTTLSAAVAVDDGLTVGESISKACRMVWVA